MTLQPRAPITLCFVVTLLLSVFLSGAVSLSHGASPDEAKAPPTSDPFAPVAFLEGIWRGETPRGEGVMIFEEIWSAPGGGVMTGMARGHTRTPASEESDTLNVLEYIIIAAEGEDLVMRFKHFRADYSTWEDGNKDDGEKTLGAPVTLSLDNASPGHVLFTATDPAAEVVSIRYFMPEEDTLQADIALLQNGHSGSFTLLFSRVE